MPAFSLLDDAPLFKHQCPLVLQQQCMTVVYTLHVMPLTLPNPSTRHPMQMDTNTSTSHEYLLESLQWATVLWLYPTSKEPTRCKHPVWFCCRQHLQPSDLCSFFWCSDLPWVSHHFQL